jgi:hypothetical protein
MLIFKRRIIYRLLLFLLALLFIGCGSGMERLLETGIGQDDGEPAPEINIMQGYTVIQSGSGIDIGSRVVGGSKDIGFTIENNGTADLNLTGDPRVYISGPDASMFTVDLQPVTPITPESDSGFTIVFSPATIGTKTITVTIENDDTDENVYTFTITGTGTATIQPEINLRQGSSIIANNGSYSFGSVLVDPVTPPTATFTIENIGDDDLNLTGIPKVEIVGADASMFTLVDNTTTPVIPSGNTSFDITFNPSAVGNKTVTVRIGNDDADEGPVYTFTVEGYAVASSAELYWTDDGTGTIQRSKLDGSGIEDVVTGLVNPFGIALDHAAGKIYWADSGNGRIQRANFDGSGLEDLVTGLGAPTGIALDIAGGRIYWTDSGTQKIQRANLDGSAVEDLVTGISELTGIALDIAGGKMYWAYGVLIGPPDDKIQRANLDGSGVEDLITGLRDPAGIALDLAGGKIYWTNSGTGPSTAAIKRTNILDGSDDENIITGLNDPTGIVLDVTAGKIYFTDPGSSTIHCANLDGSNIETLVTGINPNGINLHN